MTDHKFPLFILLFIILMDIPLFAQLDSTNLPLFVINTNGQSIPDEPKIDANLKIIYNPGSLSQPWDTGNIYTGKIGIEIRGRYSASLPQKPYGIETRDSTGENLNVPLFHMPAENDWILLANYNDKTFMRNSLTFELFRKMGHYAPRTQFCEVIIYGIYQGIYVFTEKIKRDKNRVDIATLSPAENTGDDVTGGYIFKIDYYSEYDSWESNFPPLGHPDKTVHFVYEYPDIDEISAEQKIYIQNHINDFEKFLYSGNYTLDKASQYIDIGSFIDYFILNEVARNVDAYKKSSFFYKERDSDGGLIHMGPVWDFDWAWKNINECFFGAQDGSGWAYKVHDCNVWPVPPSWMNRLIGDVAFAQLVRDRYFALRESYLSENHIFNYIDSVAQVLIEAQGRHFTRWRILGINVGAPETDEQPTTFDGEMEKFKHWISTRLSWLDNNIPGIVVTDLPEHAYEGPITIFPNPASTNIHIAARGGSIQFLSIYTPTISQIWSLTGDSSTQKMIDISDFPPGVYILTAILEDGTFWTDKFVKTD
jgi:hypothetical protein